MAQRRPNAVSTADTSTLLTIPQVADRWQLSQDTVRRAIARGDLRAVRIGRLVRIRPTDVERAPKPVTSLAALADGGGAA